MLCFNQLSVWASRNHLLLLLHKFWMWLKMRISKSDRKDFRIDLLKHFWRLLVQHMLNIAYSNREFILQDINHGAMPDFIHLNKRLLHGCLFLSNHFVNFCNWVLIFRLCKNFIGRYEISTPFYRWASNGVLVNLIASNHIFIVQDFVFWQYGKNDRFWFSGWFCWWCLD